MTRDTFLRIVAVLEAAYREKFDAQRRDVWWTLLSDLPDDLAMRATVECCRTSPYPPKPADIWARCQPSAEAREADAIAAWREARRAIADTYASWVFEDRAIPLVLEALGGTRLLSQKTDEDLDTWTRKEFLSAYKAFHTTGQQHETGKIIGLIEQGNTANGYAVAYALIEVNRAGVTVERRLLTAATPEHVEGGQPVRFEATHEDQPQPAVAAEKRESRG